MPFLANIFVLLRPHMKSNSLRDYHCFYLRFGNCPCLDIDIGYWKLANCVLLILQSGTLLSHHKGWVFFPGETDIRNFFMVIRSKTKI